MNLNFTYPVKINDRVFFVKELSFYNYKNFIKSLLVKDIETLDSTFNKLLSSVCSENIDTLNNLEKFLLLLKIRATTVGESIEITLPNKKVNVSINKIFSELHNQVPYYVYESDGIVYHFGLPFSFIPHSNVFSLAIDCMYSINGTVLDNKVKVELADNLPALPLSEICVGISKNFETVQTEIPHIQTVLTPFNNSFIDFLTSIFSYDLNSFYNLEYVLRKSLNLHAEDFNVLSLQECEILLRNYKEELLEAEKASKEKDGLSL